MKTLASFLITMFALTSCAISQVAGPAGLNHEEAAFYGIPFSLLYDDVDRLHLPYAKGTELAEGVRLRTVTFSVNRSIAVTAVFDRRGQIVEMGTCSPAAEGGKGIRVGSTLADVERAWPDGKLYYGTGEAGPYAIYFTGTNIGFRMSITSPGSHRRERKVIEIVAKPYTLIPMKSPQPH